MMLGDLFARMWRGWGALAWTITAVSLLFPHDAEAAWRRAESPQFVIFSDGAEAELRDFTRKLEEYDALLRTLTGAKRKESVNKLTLYLVADNKEVREVAPRMAPSIQGFYTAGPAGTTTFAVRQDLGSKDWASAQSIIFHEYTHHFAYQYFPANYPTWASEGLAEYFSTVVFNKDTIDVGDFQNGRVYPLRKRRWMPVEKLFNLSRDRRGVDVSMIYPQSWLVTHYLMDDPARQKQMHAYLTAIGSGESSDDAFKASFGMDYAAFDKVMKAYLKEGKILVRTLPRMNQAPIDIAVTTLPASADDLLLLNARFMTRTLAHQDDIDMKLGGKALDIVRKKAAKYPGDGLAMRTLAAGEMLYGDVQKADALLDQVLAQSPEDVEALYLKAARYILQGRWVPEQREEMWAMAKPYAGAIYKLDPNHYPALYLFALGSLAQEGAPSQNTMNAIELAHQLAPQVDEITLETAVAMARADRAADAQILLERVAFASHATAQSLYAKGLLDQVIAGKSVAHIPGEIPAFYEKAAAEVE